MKAIITEKPSAARDIARIVKAKTKNDGYFVGNGYIVTWALGHLTALALPEQYDKEQTAAKALPFVPEPFRLVVRQCRSDRGLIPDPAAVRQLGIIESVFNECDSIVVATDAGREGELIFRSIYHFLKCKKPFQRLWISSLTDEAINKGLSQLRDGREYEGLYQSAKCRLKADWLVGINASKALTISSGSANNSLGRVQTPTLAMICSRFMESSAFIPEEYWKLHITLQNGEAFRRFSYIEKVKSKAAAEELYQVLKYTPKATIRMVERKKVLQPQPLLYDLTTLQKDCNILLNLSAATTLEIAQSLYEKKLITYPRTGSRYIPDDVMEYIPALLTKVAYMPEFIQYSKSIDFDNLPRNSVDNGKITDHHALLTTGVKIAGLTSTEQSIYLMIAGRMLEAFAPVCEMESIIMEAEAQGLVFRSVSKKIIKPGWHVISKREEDKDESEEETDTGTAVFKKGQTIVVSGNSLSTGKTTPKPLFTEATLLTSMENAGKDIADELTREAMKGCGIGTPATRAAIISTLFKRDYIERSGKYLSPTEKGLAIYNVVKEMLIANPELTGSWEKALLQIERGETMPETFMQSIIIYTRQVTKEVLGAKFAHKGKNNKK